MGSTSRFALRVRHAREALLQWCILRFTGAERQFERERCDLPVRQVGRLAIYAREPLAQDLCAAVLELKTRSPYGYTLVQRYVRAIVQSDVHPAIGANVAVQYEKPDSAGRLPVNGKRYAAHLVRLAVGVRVGAKFHIPRTPRSELVAYKAELNAMRELDCEPEYFHRASNEVLRREREVRQHGRIKLAN